ncbi:MAG: hypothetical protein MRY74_11440 [Neomegalonema sp.]|nr:hypothetical protein [Neomegalonema sp.]
MNTFLRTVPLHFYLVIAYTLLVLPGFASVGWELIKDWNAPLFELPLYGEKVVDGKTIKAGIPISLTAVIVIFAFVAQWLEAIRATRVSGTSRNDIWSLILAVLTVILFVGVAQYQTFAFFVIVIVAFGDVLLDRIIGQAVAQRDFGGIIPGMGAD